MTGNWSTRWNHCLSVSPSQILSVRIQTWETAQFINGVCYTVKTIHWSSKKECVLLCYSFRFFFVFLALFSKPIDLYTVYEKETCFWQIDLYCFVLFCQYFPVHCQWFLLYNFASWQITEAVEFGNTIMYVNNVAHLWKENIL